MMDWTDRHCRVFHRLMTRRARLYTEMLTTGAIIHGDRQRLLGFDASEHPVALQLGGSDPRDLATAAKIGEDFGYDEINLNVGCPSDRVKDGRFGACLMAEPALVAEGVEAMKRAVRDSRHGQVPDRHRRPGSGTGAGCAGAQRGRRRRRCADRPRPQGLAQRTIAEGKSRHPAARLRPGVSAEGGDARCAHHHQWRHRRASTRRGGISIMSMA